MIIKRFNTESILLYLDSQSFLLRYSIAVLVVAIALLATLNIPVIGERAVFLIFFFAIIQTAFWLGLYPGILAMVLSFIAVNTLVMLPAWISKPHEALILNTGFCLLSVALIATTSLHRQLTASLRLKQHDLDHAQTIGNTGNWRMNVQRNELIWSDENYRIFGIPKGTLLTYQTFLAVVHPDDRDTVDQMWQAALRGEPYDIEHRILVAGTVKWVRERADLEFDQKGVLLGGFGTTQDITDRRLSMLELQESRQRYAGIVNSAMDAVIVIDVNQSILVFNAAAEKMFGCMADAAIGKSLDRFIPERYCHDHGTHVRAFGHTGISTRKIGFLGAITGLRSNGEEFPIEVSISQSESGDEKTYTAILRDITERVRAEHLLNDQLRLQDQLAKIAASVPGLICSFRIRPDGSSNMPYASPVLEAVLGLSADTIAEDFTPVVARIHPDDISQVNDTTAESARTLQPWRGTFRYNHPSKGEIWLESHSMPQCEMDGSILWQGYIQDVTDRKLAQTALQDRENELQLIMDATPALIAYLDTDFRYLRVNKTYENWFCIPQESILGREARDIIGEKAWAIVGPFLERARSGERVSFDYQIPYGTGKPRWVHGNYVPDKDSTGNVKGIVIHVTDIEDRKQAELERQKFISLADNSQEFIGMCDMNFRPFYVNAAGMHLVGLDTLEQAFQVPVQEFFFPEDQHFIIEEFFPRILREQRGEVEIRFRHFKTGSAIWMIYNVFYISDSKGEPVGLATVSRDITGRKQAEMALQESERQNWFLASILENSDQPLGIGFPDGRMAYVNPAFERLTGFSRDELLAMDWATELTPPEWKQAEQVKLEELQRTHQAVRYEKEYIRKDGTRVPIELLVELMSTDTGQPLRYCAFITDLTERKMTQAALRESEARLALVVEEVNAGYWDWDLVSNTLYVSPEWKRQLGFNRIELTNRTPKEDRLHPDDRAHVKEVTDNFIAGELPDFDLQFRLRHKEGSYRWIHCRGALLRDTNSRPTRLLGLNLDITDFKRTQELNARRDQMEQAFRHYVASQTASAIAHELNQPLTAISYYADVAQGLVESGNPNPEKLSGILEKCSQQALRAGQVIRQLMSILHKGEVVNELVDLNHSVHDAHTFVKSNGQLKAFNLELNLAADLPQVMANNLQVQKVLVNLLQNSLEAMRESGLKTGTITVTTCISIIDRAMVQVTVCDCGKGVADSAALKTLFQPFFTTKTTGLGMGLAISRALIEAHGGKMWAEQNPDRGLSVHFTLPVVI